MSNANLGGFVQTRETADRPESLRLRSTIVKPGTMIVHQPDIPAPVLINFPLPAWATRGEEVGDQDLDQAAREFAGKF